MARLVDLDPRWIGPGKSGASWDCHLHGPPCRFAVFFANPPDGPPRPIRTDGWLDCRWTRTGLTFETLSLSPSLDFFYLERWDAKNPADRSKWVTKPHWHGYVTNGQVT